MRRLGRMLLASLLLAQPANAADPVTDARNVVRAVLFVEARGLPSQQSVGWELCVEPALIAPRIRMQHPSRNPPHRPHRPHFWFGEVAAENGRIQAGGQVSPDIAERLFVAEEVAWGASSQPPLLSRVEPQWLVPPLSLCRDRLGLRLSSPVLVGDLAFIAVDFNCPLCGQGVLIVLERRVSGWVVIAMADQWVS
jgi:hypothetical protein